MRQIDMNSESYKKIHDTRNNWVEFVFVAKNRYNVFGKQSAIDICTTALKELERFGFKFGNMGYGGTHVHFSADIPKRYSVTIAEIMLKSHSSKKIFEQIPGFRKRYPRGSFWSGCEHHQSIGIERGKAEEYIKNQQAHHNVKVIDDTQKTLSLFN